MNKPYNICRFCKLSNYDETKYPLIKYGVRHYAHADCGLRKFGAGFFDKLSHHQVVNFPFFAAKDAGCEKELVIKINSLEAS